MPVINDGAAGDTIYLKWTTRTTTGAPTTLSGSPVVSVYKDASLTESVSGVTLTVDFDSRTGLNHVSIDTTSDGTFYANGHTFYLVITTGTVGGVSVVGEVVGSFQLAATSVAQTGDSYARLGAPAGASVSADIAEIEAETDGIAAIPTTPFLAASAPANFSSLGITAGGKISGVVLTDTLTTYTGNTLQTGDAFARLGVAGVGLTNLGDSRIANLDATVSSRSTFAGGAVASVTGNVGGNVTGSVGSVAGAVGSVTGNVGGSVGSVTGAVGSVTAAVTIDPTVVVAEAYSVKGGTATLANLLHEMNQRLENMSIVSTTMTVKKRDGTTTAMTLTTDSATNPTSIARAT